jgi:hypothetical protein
MKTVNMKFVFHIPVEDNAGGMSFALRLIYLLLESPVSIQHDK